MATYIVLANFTDQGIRNVNQGIGNVKETGKRADAFRQLAKAASARPKAIDRTLGQNDSIATVEARGDLAMTALRPGLGKAGNVRTQTLRAFSQSDMALVLGVA